MRTIASLNKRPRMRAHGTSKIGSLRLLMGPRVAAGKTVGRRIGKVRFGQ